MIRDTVKASVPKLFSCPGASASSPSREFSAERRFSATQKTYNTVGSRLLRRKPARFRGFPPCAQSKNISPRLPLWQEPGCPYGKDPATSASAQGIKRAKVSGRSAASTGKSAADRSEPASIDSGDRTSQRIGHSNSLSTNHAAARSQILGVASRAEIVCPIATLTRLRLATPSKRIFPGKR